MKFVYFLIFTLLWGCGATKKQADFIYHNGKIFTMDEKMPEANTMVIKDGKIVAIGL